MPKQKRNAAKQRKQSGVVLNTVVQIQQLVENHPRWQADQQGCLRNLDRLITTLKSQQSDEDPSHKVIPDRTTEDFQLFESWLANHGMPMDTAPFRFGFVNDEAAQENCNATLYASRDIAEDELIISVTSDMMMSTDMAPQSSIAPLLEQIPTLQSMPSITLALMLLAEAINASSKFRAYIGILPKAFTIPFGTFDASDLFAMKPSAAVDSAVKSLRAQLRNYSYIYSALVRTRLSALPLWAFSYVNYVWAISVVMTRQNALPIGNPPPLALVPVWDMCNHAYGAHTTSVVMSPDGGDVNVQYRAMKAFESGEAITIFYGPRPNHQLLQFSGFVQEDNPYDEVPLTVRIGCCVELAPFKARLIGKAGMDIEEEPSGCCWNVSVNVEEGGENIAKLIALCRILVMDKAGISNLLKSGDSLPTAQLDDVSELAARELARRTIGSKLAEYEAVAIAKDGKVGSGTNRLIQQLHVADMGVLKKSMSKV